MSVADYDALKRYLEQADNMARPVFGTTLRLWVPRAQRTYRFNDDEDGDALLRQATEAARLLGMGCAWCEGTGQAPYQGVPYDEVECFHCGGNPFNSDTPAIDRLAIPKLGRAGAPWQAVPGVRMGNVPLPTSPCEDEDCNECLGTGWLLPYDGTSGRPPDCLKPDHEYHQPRDWSIGAPCPCAFKEVGPHGQGVLRPECKWHDESGRIAHGPGVRGLRDDSLSWRFNDRSPVPNPGGVMITEPLDYPCGNNPDPEDDAAWEHMDECEWRSVYASVPRWKRIRRAAIARAEGKLRGKQPPEAFMLNLYAERLLAENDPFEREDEAREAIRCAEPAINPGA